MQMFFDTVLKLMIRVIHSNTELEKISHYSLICMQMIRFVINITE